MSYKKYIEKYKRTLFMEHEKVSILSYIGAFVLQALIILFLFTLWLGPVASYGVTATGTPTGIDIPITHQVIISDSQYEKILQSLRDLNILENATPTFVFGSIPIEITSTGVHVPDTVPATMTLGFYKYVLKIHLHPKIIDYRTKPIFHISPSLQAVINSLPSIGISVHINWKQIEGGINFTRSSLSSSTYSVLPYLAWRPISWIAVGMDCSGHLLVIF